MASTSPKTTTAILQRLRFFMRNSEVVKQPLQAYIVPSGDAHQSEYIAPCDCRRQYVSGFTGSAGTAIVTEQCAALWTDGRYHLQAEEQLDSNWTLMKEGVAATPTQADWLSKSLPEGARIGVDPFLLSVDVWRPLSEKLKQSGRELVPINQNLIDLVWDDRPASPSNHIDIQPLQFAGKTWQDKIHEVRGKMNDKDASVLVVTALDELAWLFNMRGSDIEYNPVFFAYALIGMDRVSIYVDEAKVTPEIHAHLTSDEHIKVTLHAYADLCDDLCRLEPHVSGRVWIPDQSSHGLARLVPERRRISDPSPIALMKALKNAAEIAGMQNAHVKDAVALCELFAWLEKEVPKGGMTELKASAKAEQFRSQQADFVSLSFGTISSSGPNGAIIHYQPTEASNRPVTMQELYLLDSGAQYRDGTTDVTRTMHFGEPSQLEMECYTRVLKGHIALDSLIFPSGTKGHVIDCNARKALWDVGLDYMHGTGHGVGAFLNVHEAPISKHNSSPDGIGTRGDMTITIEPGYYEDGLFGCRIENVCLVVIAETAHRFHGKDFLTYEPITLVPIQTKLIDRTIFTQQEMAWLNRYHARCREVVAPVLKQQGRTEALQWLLRETEHIE
ncbi:PREDICTED: xaa-Pro aminopeptidase 1-like isoform X2 [Priapulus caudatus]|uniref:Xaa-Pro aminopeptidase 1-like isoform X2 n=1 Tax=Priapulus caudatus TaxID=37621 RepID=A0ABM1E6G9_PRICU|nr:PREDICTED: xaa-Pro aminopeptidase 1-like isoform X2 [Priapulus caudatus]